MDDQDLSPGQRQKSSAIVAATRTHFATRGFEPTKLSEVARDAGVAVGTIYLRYSSKAELLAELLPGSKPPSTTRSARATLGPRPSRSVSH